MSSEEIFDKILRKFEGNKSFSWDEIHEKEFYEDIDRDYFVVENHLNFLLGDNALDEKGEPKMISLSRRGLFMMTNFGTHGYVAQQALQKKKDDREKATVNWAIWATVFSGLAIILWLLEKFVLR